MAGSQDLQQLVPAGLLTPDVNANAHDRRCVYFDGARLVLEVPGATGTGRAVEFRRKSVVGAPITTVTGGIQFNGNLEVPSGGGLATVGVATDTIVLAPFGNTALTVVGVALAVDNLQVTPAATANPATVDLAGIGTDANIDLAVTPKGTGVLNVNYASVALGGGAAPTLGTIGGSGPGTAGQNAWLKVKIAGTASFIPFWR